MKLTLEQLLARQVESEKYYEETYDGNIARISGAEPMDNQSWEIGFYEGLQHAIDIVKENR